MNKKCKYKPSDMCVSIRLIFVFQQKAMHLVFSLKHAVYNP